MKRVILLHGIRERARWYAAVRAAFEKRDIAVETPGYDYFPLPAFLIPGPWRSAVERKMAKAITGIFLKHPDDEISIVAFSYGTQVVASALDTHPDLDPQNVIFCGAVASRHLNWAAIVNRVSGQFINECGSRDPWPPVAQAITFRYSAAGTYGLQQAGVRDRFHDTAHTPTFKSQGRPIYEFWADLVATGAPAPQTDDGTTPLWFRLISPELFRSSAVATLALAAFFGFQPTVENIFQRCFVGCRNITMTVARNYDYRASQCVGEMRDYSEIISDHISFSSYVKEYNPTARQQRGYPPPRLVDTRAGQPFDYIIETKNCPADKTCYRFKVPVNGRTVQVVWHHRGQPSSRLEDAPGGYSFRGRHPVTRISFTGLAPDQVKFEAGTPSLPTSSLPGEEQERLLQACGPENRGLACDFGRRGEALPAEQPIMLPFTAHGWTSCPATGTPSSQAKAGA